LRVVGAALERAGLEAVQRRLGHFGHQANAVHVHHLQRTVRLVQMRFCVLELGCLIFRCPSTRFEQRGARARQRLADFHHHPRQGSGVQLRLRRDRKISCGHVASVLQ
jgi:hypothetical protein